MICVNAIHVNECRAKGIFQTTLQAHSTNIPLQESQHLYKFAFYIPGKNPAKQTLFITN